MTRVLRHSLAVAALVFFTCASLPVGAQNLLPAASSASQRLAPGFTVLEKESKILIAPLDVELFNITAGGVAEPKADWTQAAQTHMSESIVQVMTGAGLKVTQLDSAKTAQFVELLHLHTAVAQAISIHHANQDPQRLPTKEGGLEWSLGDGLKPLSEVSGARYALFTWVRDGYASPERKAMMVGTAIVGALFGVVVVPGGGLQAGYASLVDMHTGRVLWFNRLQRSSGDLRDAQSARESVDALLAEWPAAIAR